MTRIAIVLVLILSAACGDTFITVPTAPTPAPVTPVADRIEFRVAGNASSVTIRHSDPLNGLTYTVTTLPYIASFTTNQAAVFLSLEATPLTFPLNVTAPFLSAQIVVNGGIFREASSVDRTSTVSVNGTYRR